MAAMGTAAKVCRPAAGVAPFPGTGVGPSLSGLASRLCDALLTAGCGAHARGSPAAGPAGSPREVEKS